MLNEKFNYTRSSGADDLVPGSFLRLIKGVRYYCTFKFYQIETKSLISLEKLSGNVGAGLELIASNMSKNVSACLLFKE